MLWPASRMSGVGGANTIPPLGQQRVHNVAPHIREAVIAPLVAIGEPFVVDAQTVQQGGLKIVHVDRVRDHLVPEFVGGADGHQKRGHQPWICRRPVCSYSKPEGYQELSPYCVLLTLVKPVALSTHTSS